MSLLLLFRPRSGVGGEPEPEPPPVIVATPAGVKRKRYMSMKDFESRDTLEKFLRGQLQKNSPEALPDPLAEQRAAADRKRLKAQQKREAEMRRKAEAEEKKRKSVQAYNESLLALIAAMLEDDDT